MPDSNEKHLFVRGKTGIGGWIVFIGGWIDRVKEWLLKNDWYNIQSVHKLNCTDTMNDVFFEKNIENISFLITWFWLRVDDPLKPPGSEDDDIDVRNKEAATVGFKAKKVKKKKRLRASSKAAFTNVVSSKQEYFSEAQSLWLSQFENNSVRLVFVKFHSAVHIKKVSTWVDADVDSPKPCWYVIGVTKLSNSLKGVRSG